jgi:hypothetical protein
MVGGVRIVRTHTYVLVLLDGVERPALRTSTSVPVDRACMVGAAMVWMTTAVAAPQAGRATTVTLILMTACLSLVLTVVYVATALMNTPVDAREAGVEITAKTTLTNVHHPRV